MQEKRAGKGVNRVAGDALDASTFITIALTHDLIAGDGDELAVDIEGDSVNSDQSRRSTKNPAEPQTTEHSGERRCQRVATGARLGCIGRTTG
jgi:hypothetical protein